MHHKSWGSAPHMLLYYSWLLSTSLMPQSSDAGKCLLMIALISHLSRVGESHSASGQHFWKCLSKSNIKPHFAKSAQAIWQFGFTLSKGTPEGSFLRPQPPLLFPEEGGQAVFQRRVSMHTHCPGPLGWCWLARNSFDASTVQFFGPKLYFLICGQTLESGF